MVSLKATDYERRASPCFCHAHTAYSDSQAAPSWRYAADHSGHQYAAAELSRCSDRHPAVQRNAGDAMDGLDNIEIEEQEPEII